jgi:putative transposase
MKVIYKSYKFKIEPTSLQKTFFAKHFGVCRFVYNYYLNMRKETYLNDKISLNYYDNMKDLVLLKKEENFNWLKEVNSQSIQQSVRNLDTAYNRFYRKQSNFPKFKSKNNKQSFTIPQYLKIDNNKLIIPKFREGIKINLHRQIEGKILFGTISKSTTGKYYASITCEIEYNPYQKTGSKIGIDAGIKNLATLSNGEIYENVNSLKFNLKKLKYEQRQLSKKQKDSSSYLKQKQKLAKLYEKITNIRTNHLHKVTTNIIKNHDIICVEDLHVKDMMKRKDSIKDDNGNYLPNGQSEKTELNRYLADAALGTFYQMLKYKAKWNDKLIIKIDRYFPSSKMCNKCSYIKQDLKLSDRSWTCPNCNTHHDRDYNASQNILRQGLNMLSEINLNDNNSLNDSLKKNLISGSGIESDIKQKQSKALLIGESMTSEAHPIAFGVGGSSLSDLYFQPKLSMSERSNDLSLNS